MRRCSFYFGIGRGDCEGLGTATSGGWLQPVLDAVTPMDYFHKVLRAIDIAPPATDHEAECALAWFDASLWARIGGHWVRWSPALQGQLLGR